MKIKLSILVLAVLSIAVSLMQSSCSSSKKSAVSCPDFSHSRNMKSRHTQIKSTYPDRQERYYTAAAWDRQARFGISFKRSDAGNPDKYSSAFQDAARTGMGHDRDNILFTTIQPVRPQMASLVIPAPRGHMQASASAELPATTGNPEPGLQGCDSIVLRNGDIMEARVIEIGQREIRYRKCGDNEGPVFVVNLTDVFMIKYPNGTRDYFTSDRNPAPSMGGTVAKKADGMAVAGFIGSMAGLFILGIPLGIMAVVFGFVSLGKIRRHPDRYRGKGFAIASIIIGAIDVIGMLIILGSM